MRASRSPSRRQASVTRIWPPHAQSPSALASANAGPENTTRFVSGCMATAYSSGRARWTPIRMRGPANTSSPCRLASARAGAWSSTWALHGYHSSSSWTLAQNRRASETVGNTHRNASPSVSISYPLHSVMYSRMMWSWACCISLNAWGSDVLRSVELWTSVKTYTSCRGASAFSTSWKSHLPSTSPPLLPEMVCRLLVRSNRSACSCIRFWWPRNRRRITRTVTAIHTKRRANMHRMAIDPMKPLDRSGLTMHCSGSPRSSRGTTCFMFAGVRAETWFWSLMAWAVTR